MAYKLPVQNYFARTTDNISWDRPTDWPTITPANFEVKFLMSDINNASCSIFTSFTRSSGSQNIIIDWGDGTTDTITTTTSTNTTHQYTAGTGVPCSRGYTTFVIRVAFTGTGTSVLNDCRITSRLPAGNTTTPYDTIGLLEIHYGDGTQTVSMDGYYSSNLTNGLCTAPFLEYARLPRTVSFTSMQNTFENCTNLVSVIMPVNASSLSNMTGLFKGCTNLLSVTLPTTTALTSLTQIFYECHKLISVKFPGNLNSVTTISELFYNCYNLKTLTLTSLNSVTSITTLVFNCHSLEWVKFDGLPTFASATTVTFSSTFQNCSNLQTVYFPQTCSANARYVLDYIFSITPIKHITFPVGFNPSSMVGTFNGNTALTSVVFQSAAPALTNITQIFQNCKSLNKLRLPDSVSSSGINMTQAFQFCYALTSLTIPSTYLFTNLGGAFQQCKQLKTLNWSPGVQNSLTSLNGTFQQCTSLTSITLPTSVTSLTSLDSTFDGCGQLVSITLPSSLNAVASAGGVFNGCVKLRSVTFPTSMPALANMFSMFYNCTSLTNVVLPNTVSNTSPNWSRIFNQCVSLKTVTLPGSIQYTNVFGPDGLFLNCGNLTTINNLDKMGSLTGTSTANIQIREWNYIGATSLTFPMRLSELKVNNTAAGKLSKLTSLRLTNTGTSQWNGFSPHINISYTGLPTAAIVQVFNDLAAQGTVSGKVINITGAAGTAGLTAGDRNIITSIGWTITG